MKKISNGIYMLSGEDRMEEAKEEMQFKNSNLSLVGVGKDTNGNTVVKVKYPNDPAFSIQTGSIQKVHDLVKGQKMKDILALSDKDKETIEKEVTDYVKKYGSAKQKSGLKEAVANKNIQRNIGNDIMKYGIDDYFYSLFTTISSLYESMSGEGKQKQGGLFGKILDHLGSAGTAASKIDMDRGLWESVGSRLKPGQKLYTEDGKMVEVEEGDCLKGNVLSEDTYDYNMIMDFVKKNPDDEYMNTMQLVGDNSKTKFMNVPNTILIDLAKMMKNK